MKFSKFLLSIFYILFNSNSFLFMVINEETQLYSIDIDNVDENWITISNNAGCEIKIDKKIIESISQILKEEFNADIASLPSSNKIIFQDMDSKILELLAKHINELYKYVTTSCKHIHCIENGFYNPLIEYLFKEQLNNIDEMHQLFRPLLESVESFQNSNFKEEEKSLMLSKQDIFNRLQVKFKDHRYVAKRSNIFFTIPLVVTLALAIGFSFLSDFALDEKMSTSPIIIISTIMLVGTFLGSLIFWICDIKRNIKANKVVGNYLFDDEIYTEKPKYYTDEIEQSLKITFSGKAYPVFVKAAEKFAEKQGVKITEIA